MKKIVVMENLFCSYLWIKEMVFIYVWGILFKEVGFICMVFYLLVKY